MYFSIAPYHLDKKVWDDYQAAWYDALQYIDANDHRNAVKMISRFNSCGLDLAKKYGDKNLKHDEMVLLSHLKTHNALLVEAGFSSKGVSKINDLLQSQVNEISKSEIPNKNKHKKKFQRMGYRVGFKGYNPMINGMAMVRALTDSGHVQFENPDKHAASEASTTIHVDDLENMNQSKVLHPENIPDMVK